MHTPMDASWRHSCEETIRLGGGGLGSSREDSAGTVPHQEQLPCQVQQPSPLHVLKEALPSRAAWFIPPNHL